MFKEYSVVKQKLNKSHLPSIHQGKKSATTSMRSKYDSNTSHYNFNIDRQPYDQMSNQQIKLQSKRLKVKIQQINKKLNSAIQKTSIWRLKSLEKKNLTKQEQQSIIQKQADNNNKMLNLYAKQLQQLQDRKINIKEGVRNSVLSQILEMEEKIFNIKLVIKQMKKKMHTKEKKIVEGADQKKIEQNNIMVRELQKQHSNITSKVNQIRLNLQVVESKTQRLKFQNQSCIQQYKKAQQTVRDINQRIQKGLQEERTLHQYTAKLNQVEAARRKLQYAKSNGEQKYLNKLKQLDIISSLNGNYAAKQIIKKIEDSRQAIKGLSEILLQQQQQISEQIKQDEMNKVNAQQFYKQQKERLLSELLANQRQNALEAERTLAEQSQQQIHQIKQQQTHLQIQKTHKQPQQLVQQSNKDEQYNPNSMFLTMPQQSKQQTVYKSPSKKMDDLQSLQSQKTVSLRYIEPDQKSKNIQKQINNTVSEAKDAVQSIKNLLKNSGLHFQQNSKEA